MYNVSIPQHEISNRNMKQNDISIDRSQLPRDQGLNQSRLIDP